MEDKIVEIVAEIDKALVERNASFPDRLPANDERLQVLLETFVEHVNALSLENPSDSEVVNKTTSNELSDNCLFLCGYMKCGTTLLLELLDSHPELICLPGDSWFRGHRYLVGDRSAQQFALSFRDKWLGRLINPTGQAPFWLFGKHPRAYINFTNHYNRWLEIVNDPSRGHLLSTVLAYYSANPRRPARPKMWVEKTPGNEFDTKRILHYFPEAKFLHIVRDPRENFASIKRLYQTRKWDWKPLEMAKNIGKSCRLSEENQTILGKENYLILQYERLTENPQASMEKICKFLDIEWHDSLLTPSVNGTAAESNTMYHERKVTGSIRPATKDRWNSILNTKEKRAILNVIRDARKAGYDWNVSFKERIMNRVDKLFYHLNP